MAYSYIHLPNGDKVADVFKVNSFPTVFIIDKAGLIIDVSLGFQEEDLERIIRMIEKNI